MRRALCFALALPLAAGEPDTHDLKATHPKGWQVPYDVRISVKDMLERDLWSTNDWKECRYQELDWHFKLAARHKEATAQAVVLEAIVKDFRGTWTDRSPDDKGRPEVAVSFPGEGKDPWEKAIAAMEGATIRIALGPRGGVSKVTGVSERSKKLLGPLLAEKKTKALAQDLSAWLSDEGWAALLDAAWLPAEKGASWKQDRKHPFPWTEDFQGRKPPPVPMAFAASEGWVKAVFDHGKVDEMLQFIGQPGFHSLGVSQQGECRALYDGSGLRESTCDIRIRDRWDLYRMNAKADRFDRNVTAALTVGRAVAAGASSPAGDAP